MNLLNIIQNEKTIGGLEISDDGFRFSQISKDKTGLKIELLFEDLITEKEALGGETVLTNKLVRFIKQHNLEYVIVSIPANNVFVKTYDFNINMGNDKIADAMKLNVELQLPKKKSEIYCDWMDIEDKENKKVLLAYVLRGYVNSLIAKIKNTGIKIVAIESHQLSIARVLKQELNETTLVIERGAIYTSFYIIKDNNLLFSQFLPNDIIGKNINKEINKIINYQDWLNNLVSNIILIGPFTDTETKKMPLKVKKIEPIDELKPIQNSKWIITLGAALRGLLPRKDDKIISLMEVDTEKAYYREKINSTVSFLVGTSIGLSIFFISAFLATWYLILATVNNYNKQISTFNSSSSESYNNVQEKADYFNSLIEQTSILAKKETAWSEIITEIKNRTTDNIVISNVSLPSANSELIITGTASNREAINKLKTSFESSEIFNEINIPLNNLEKKSSIPFSMTFKIKI